MSEKCFFIIVVQRSTNNIEIYNYIESWQDGNYGRTSIADSVWMAVVLNCYEMLVYLRMFSKWAVSHLNFILKLHRQVAEYIIVYQNLALEYSPFVNC